MSRYIPGKDFTPDPTKVNVLRQKRNLSADEFQFYYNYLDSSLSDPVKAGLAVVLMADTSRLFGVYRNYFVDPTLKTYVEKFEAYPEGSSQKAVARKEIKKFDSYLSHSALPSDIKIDEIRKKRLSYAKLIGASARQAEKQQKVESLLQSEKDKMLSEKQTEAMKEQSKIVAQAIEDHMRKKIRAYLGAIYNESVGKYFMDKKLSEIEYEIRLYLIDLVEKKDKNPVKAINAYQSFVENLPKNPSLSKAKAIINRKLEFYSHPMEARLYG